MDKQIEEKLFNLVSLIDANANTSYENSLDVFIDYVNENIKQRDDLSTLIGLNNFELVENNHKNHTQFMHTIFVTKDIQSLHDTYIWAYQTYHAKGFDFKYFYLELHAWKEAFELEDKESLASIIELYKYLISMHDHFVQHATSNVYELPKTIDDNVYKNFIDAILKPDLAEAISISRNFIKINEDINNFWEYIILPSLYEVGVKWANAEISVGEEHMATSICQRVMSEHYSKIIKCVEDTKKILVTTSPNELHEVGSRMLADILELNGHDVTFVSSKSTTKEKLDIIDIQEIEFVIISVTMVSNIIKTQELVTQIKTKFKDIIVIVGGQAFSQEGNANLLPQADYLIQSKNELLNLLKKAI